MICFRILVAGLIIPMTLLVASAQKQRQSPFELKIAEDKVDRCSERIVKLKASLINVSSNVLLIDKKGIGDVISFSVIGFKLGKLTSSHRTIISDGGQDDDPDFLLLDPSDTHESIIEISLNDSFFEQEGYYEIKVGYRQFQKKSYRNKHLWIGTVYAEPITVTLGSC